MLQTIREKTAGVVVKVLFLFLVLSFAVWGIGDYRFLQRGDTPAIAIGGDPVPAEVLRQEFQRDLDRLRRSIGDVDRDLIRQFGLATQTVERVANQWTLDRAAERLALVVSDDVVRQRIQADPGFRSNGVFDAIAFRRLLQENGYSEQRYVELARGDAARAALVESVTIGAAAPRTVAELLYRHREEKRRGTAIRIPASAMPDPGAPTEAQLTAVYEANAERFTDPELRGGIVVRIGIDEVRAAVPIDDAQLRAEFDARKRDFSTPERRTLELIRFDDAAAAVAARRKLEEGADFLAVAAEAGQSPEQVRAFGRVAQSSLPRELAAPIFALPQDVASAPIETALGVFLARTTAIEAAIEPGFEALRGRLAEEQVQRNATEIAYRTATRIEELLNEGRPLQDAAAAAGIAVLPVEAVDNAGRDRDGAPLPLFAATPELLRAFLEAPLGRDSGLIEPRAGGYFFLRVDSVTPSRKRELAAVRDDATAIWKAEARAAAARARADAALASLRGGRTADEVASAAGVAAQTLPALRRDGRAEADAPADAASIAARLFQLKPGEAGIAPVADGFAVVALGEILPADPAQAGLGLERLAESLEQSMSGEVARQYLRALRDRLKVVVDQAAVDKLYQN
jgi:peptidyl-prolyl cis-trans isomerase D